MALHAFMEVSNNSAVLASIGHRFALISAPKQLKSRFTPTRDVLPDLRLQF